MKINWILVMIALLCFLCGCYQATDKNIQGAYTNKEISIEPKYIDIKDKVISKNNIDFDSDDQMEEIRIILDDGYFNEDTELWAGSGPKWEGRFSIQVLDDDKEVFKTSLNNLFNHSEVSIFFYAPEFEIDFFDYNDDGTIDFILTQYCSSNLSMYYMLTVKKDGTIERLNIENQHAFMAPLTRNNSAVLPVEDNRIVTYCYNNMEGKYYYNYYKWNDKEKMFRHEERKP